MPGIELYLGDCLDILPTLPAASVDMVLADLPYATTGLRWDTLIPLEPLWAQYKRLIKPCGAIVLFCAQPFTTALIMSNRAWFKYTWVWEKSNAGGCLNARRRPMRKHEDIAVFSEGTTANGARRPMPYYPQGLAPMRKPRKRTNHYGHSGECGFKTHRISHTNYIQEAAGYPTSVLHFPNDRPALHPAQKPLALCEYLIRTYTQEGETVLDNVMGSGTTLVACGNTARRGIGIEKDPRWFRVAQTRLAEVGYA